MSEKYITGPEDNRNRRHKARQRSLHENLREQTMRSFFGNRTGRLEMERMQRPERAISECIDELMKKRIQNRKSFCFETFKVQWPSIVGQVVARHAFPSALYGHQLIIEVDNSAALYSYEHYMKDEILTKVKREAKAVKDIRFVPANRNIGREKKRL